MVHDWLGRNFTPLRKSLLGLVDILLTLGSFAAIGLEEKFSASDLGYALFPSGQDRLAYQSTKGHLKLNALVNSLVFEYLKALGLK